MINNTDELERQRTNYMQPIFITGIGTGVGKTIVSAIVTESLKADYWKPIQAGFDEGTDTLSLKELISNTVSVIHTEVYKLKLPASPHIAAREEGSHIDLSVIMKRYHQLYSVIRPLVIEGAGGIMVPLNEDEFVADLIVQLNARVILVSRNYLGSINHSLLTAEFCKQRNIDVAGWIFNDQYLDYEKEILRWSGYPKLLSIPFSIEINKNFVLEQSTLIQSSLQHLL
jgi:dethiobiotin synthetase